MPEDEWQAISLSYTSGTTGNPKGVVYHHRGAYLMSTGSAVAWNMPNRLNFLNNCPYVSLQWLVLSLDYPNVKWKNCLS